jgi:hypothetical protein
MISELVGQPGPGCLHRGLHRASGVPAGYNSLIR